MSRFTESVITEKLIFSEKSIRSEAPLCPKCDKTRCKKKASALAKNFGVALHIQNVMEQGKHNSKNAYHI